MFSRLTVPLDSCWNFQADPASESIAQKWHEHGLPEGQEVNIPHTWNIQDGLEDYRGTCWYSYSLLAESEWEGKLLRLQFDAVYRDAVIWVNGHRAGEHSGSGYTMFIVDISAYVRPGELNRLTVSVNNENSNLALPHSNSFDWADDGGIIRGVSLLVTGRVAIDYAKLKATPVFAQDDSNAEYGILSGELCLSGANSDALNGQDLTIGITLWDKDHLIGSDEYVGKPVNGRLQLSDLRVEQPRLWHFDHPHLYAVRISLLVDGHGSDEIIVKAGFREIKTDGSKLLLNREPGRLMGVEWMPGSHPDRGMAETEEQLAEMLGHIKHANCVITRFHWQQDSKLLDWCDRHGLLVQEEIPHWAQPFDPTDELMPLSLQHAKEMINRHYNHPCIYAWGIGNEVNGQSHVTVRYFGQLRSAVLGLDDTRLVNFVSNTLQENPAKDATGVGDLIMWNDYIGTWHGDLDRPGVLQQINEDYPDKPIVVAEFGLCEPAFAGGDERRLSILTENTEEYRKHPAIAALIYFSLNDYRTQMGEDGTGRHRQRIHGSMDCYGRPKPSFEELRRIGSPIRLSVSYSDSKLVLGIEVRNDLPSHRIFGYRIQLESAIEQLVSEHEIPMLSPGERFELIIPNVAPKGWENIGFQIRRPTGFSVMDGQLGQFLS